MGLPCGVSVCSTPEPAEKSREAVQRPRGNPDPTRFTVERAKQIGRFTVALVRYPDAANYEGLKVLVYEGIHVPKLRRQPTLDPHFCEHAGHLSPIARFTPDELGWTRACALCVLLG